MSDGLLAFERSPGAWIAAQARAEEGVDTAFQVADGDEVVGVVDDGSAAHRPLLVVRDGVRRRLQLLNERGRDWAIASEPLPIEEIALSMVEPMAAYLTGSRLCIIRLG